MALNFPPLLHFYPEYSPSAVWTLANKPTKFLTARKEWLEISGHVFWGGNLIANSQVSNAPRKPWPLRWTYNQLPDENIDSFFQRSMQKNHDILGIIFSAQQQLANCSHLIWLAASHWKSITNWRYFTPFIRCNIKNKTKQNTIIEVRDCINPSFKCGCYVKSQVTAQTLHVCNWHLAATIGEASRVQLLL